MSNLHDQAEQLRKAVGDVPEDPEDSIDYAGLKASVAVVCRKAVYLAARATHSRCGFHLSETAASLSGYLKDMCSVHDIDIPEGDE